MKKVLFTATVDAHILAFHTPYLKMFKEQGYEVHVATNGDGKIPYCDKKHIVSFERNPFKLKNFKAFKSLKKIIGKEKFDIIHAHTPVGGVLTRLASKTARREGTKVIYTAHGFHFYKGSSLLNWIFYYPIEKWLSKYTDCLITINKDDYNLARKKFKKVNKIEYVYGVGLDTVRLDKDIKEKELDEIREQFKIQKNDIVLTYVAELNKNKNQKLLINAIEKSLKQGDKKYILLLVGDGQLKYEYEKYIKKKQIQNNIKFLGKREDIQQILSLTDIYVASSFREGLPVNIMEAMYMGLPIVATDNRGHRELINDNENGFLIKNEIELVEKIKQITKDNNLSEKFKKNNKEKCQKYIINTILKDMEKIYFGNL